MKLIAMVLSVFMLCVTPFVSAGTQHASVVPVSAVPIKVSGGAMGDELFNKAKNAAIMLVGAGFVIHGVVAMGREDGKPMMSLLVGVGLMAVPSLLSYFKHVTSDTSAGIDIGSGGYGGLRSEAWQFR